MSDSEPHDIWECKRTGSCCQLFVFTGVQVSESEWDLLELEIKSLRLSHEVFDTCKNQKTLPLIGEQSPKKCAFLSDNRCLIYAKRPRRCREYPIIVTKTEDSVTLHISTDCPRSESISTIIRTNPPYWIKDQLKDKKIKIVIDSFFEKSMCELLGEEY